MVFTAISKFNHQFSWILYANIYFNFLGKDFDLAQGQVEVNGSSDPRKGPHSHQDVGYCQQVQLGLCVAKQHPCVGSENGYGFSPEYVLHSFQILTPSGCHPKADLLVWDKAMPTQ